MSQALGSPLSKPFLNQFVRCSDEPCVQLSRLTRPVACSWRRSSPTAAAAARPSSRSPLSSRLLLVGRVGPDAGEAVGLQLEPDREVVGVCRARGLLALDVVHDAEQVLHVVPELVGDHVGLSEVAGRGEPRAEVAEEPEIEIDLAVERAVERPRLRGADAATGPRGPVEEHEPRRLVLLARVREGRRPRALHVLHDEGGEVLELGVRVRPRLTLRPGHLRKRIQRPRVGSSTAPEEIEEEQNDEPDSAHSSAHCDGRRAAPIFDLASACASSPLHARSRTQCL